MQAQYEYTTIIGFSTFTLNHISLNHSLPLIWHRSLICITGIATEFGPSGIWTQSYPEPASWSIMKCLLSIFYFPLVTSTSTKEQQFLTLRHTSHYYILAFKRIYAYTKFVTSLLKFQPSHLQPHWWSLSGQKQSTVWGVVYRVFTKF